VNRPLVYIWLAIWLCLAGCSTFEPRTIRIDAAAGMYQKVTLKYKVDGGQLSEPLTVARIAGQHVTQERLPSSPYPDRSVARLSIQYPHPDGKAGYALAEMVVETHTPANAQAAAKKAAWEQWADAFASTARDILPGVKMSDGVYEAWAMDISKNDLDRVVAGLSQSGYFVNPSKQTLGVELAARVDNFQAVKRWSHEAELDILMQRIREEGRLVSYERPVERSGAAMNAAGGQANNRVMLVSQEQAGPALVPAGPQNNAYSDPSPAMRPAPSPAYVPSYPQQAAPAAAPPPGFLPSYPRPPVNAAPSSGSPQSRWPSPQQNRRSAAPAPATPAPPQAGTVRARIAPFLKPPRMPWQRRTSEPNAQQPAPRAAVGYDPRRSRYGNPQPPPSARQPSRFQRSPAKAPAPRGPFPANPQADAASNGYPPNLPQPPQITTRSSPY
jgi:hypothetical protein